METICHQVGSRLATADAFSLAPGGDSQSHTSPKTIDPFVVERILALFDAFFVDFLMNQPIALPSFSRILGEGLELLGQILLFGLVLFGLVAQVGTSEIEQSADAPLLKPLDLNQMPGSHSLLLSRVPMKWVTSFFEPVP